MFIRFYAVWSDNCALLMNFRRAAKDLFFIRLDFG